MTPRGHQVARPPSRFLSGRLACSLRVATCQEGFPRWTMASIELARPSVGVADGRGSGRGVPWWPPARRRGAGGAGARGEGRLWRTAPFSVQRQARAFGRTRCIAVRPDALGGSALGRRSRVLPHATFVRVVRGRGGPQRQDGRSPTWRDRRLDRSPGRTSDPWRTASARPRPRQPGLRWRRGQGSRLTPVPVEVEGAAGRGGCEVGPVDRACVPASVPVPFDPTSSSVRTSTLASAGLRIGRAVRTRAPVVGLRDPHWPAVTPGLGRDRTVPRAPGVSGRRGVARRVHRRGGDRGPARATRVRLELWAHGRPGGTKIGCVS